MCLIRNKIREREREVLQLIEVYSFLVKREELRARVCFDSGCRTVGYAIPPQNQLVMRKILKSFMVFDIIPHGPIFRVVVGSQIVVPPTIPLSQ